MSSAEGEGGEVGFTLGFLEALECGKMRVMTRETTPGRRTTRRYTKQEKDQAVRLMFALRRELGMSRITPTDMTTQPLLFANYDSDRGRREQDHEASTQERVGAWPTLSCSRW
ncbi:hypothetical protein MNBD_ACTINO02-3160 [hydrothermal vent metagenome]|uniref:Uncharacterized protein n=1 Tax=hydrothermal vent metagenome TaxID=652676 RepID=A0A3B0RFK9_9ZZZZ